MQIIPKQVLRIQLQQREQIVEVPTVLHVEQLVENPQLIAEAVVQVLRVDVQYVDKECRRSLILKSWQRSVKLWDRSQECDQWRIVEQIVYNQVPQIQEQVMPSTDHPDSSENSGGSTSVVLY